MKKIFATMFLALVAVCSVSAQQKGDVFIGGDFGVGVSHASVAYGDYGDMAAATAIDFTIAPKFGVFVANNFMIGFGLGYGVESSDGAATHTLTLGPSFSYYVPLCKNLYYTPTLDLGFCYMASDGEGIPGFGLGLSVFGLEYRPSPRIGISGSLLSLDYMLLARDGVKVNMVDFGFRLNPTVGVKLYF